MLANNLYQRGGGLGSRMMEVAPCSEGAATIGGEERGVG